MDPTYFVKGILLGLLVSVPLGPVGVLCIQKTVGKGWKSGMFGGLGAVLADTLFASISGLGISFIIDFLTEQSLIIQIVGGIVLVLLSYRVFFTNPAVQVRKQQRTKVKGWEDFFATFFLALSNPATIFVFIAAFAGFVVQKDSGIIQLLTTILGVTTGCAAWWYLIISTVNRFRSRIRLKNLWWINKITGFLIFAFGVVILARLVLQLF